MKYFNFFNILKLNLQDAKQELDETWDYNFDEHQQFQKNGGRNVNKVILYEIKAHCLKTRVATCSA